MKFLATLALAFALANTGNAGHVNLPLVDLMSHARFTDFKAMLAAGADPNEADDGSSGARPLHFGDILSTPATGTARRPNSTTNRTRFIVHARETATALSERLRAGRGAEHRRGARTSIERRRVRCRREGVSPGALLVRRIPLVPALNLY